MNNLPSSSDYKYINDCLETFNTINNYEDGNYLYVDSSNSLKIQKEDQSSFFGSYKVSIAKTLTNSFSFYTGTKADWKTVASKIHSAINTFSAVVEDLKKNSSLLRDDKQFIHLDKNLGATEEALQKISNYYSKQGESKFIRAENKKEAAFCFNNLLAQLKEKHQLLHKILNEKNLVQVNKKEESLIEEDMEIEDFDLLEEDLKQSKEIQIQDSQYSSQFGHLAKRIRENPNHFSLKNLKKIYKNVQEEQKRANITDKTFLDELSKLEGEITARSKLVDEFKNRVKIFKEQNKEMQLSEIGTLDSRLFTEGNILHSLKEAGLEKAALNVIQSIDIKQLGKADLKQIRGAAVILYERIKDWQDRAFKEPNLKLPEEIQTFTDALLLANQVLIKQDSDNQKKDTGFQTTIAVSYHQLIAHYQKEKNNKMVLQNIENLRSLPITSAQPLGDLQAITKTAAQKSALWLQTGGTLARRRNVRVQLKTIKESKGNQQELNLTFTVPRSQRDQLKQHIDFLDSQNVLDKYGISISKELVSYPEIDFKDKTYKGESLDRKQINVGEAHKFDNKKGTISVLIGAEEERWNQFQKVSIRLNPSVTAQELHEFLSVIGLSTVLFESRAQDIVNENLARLIHATYPREVVSLNSPEECVQLGLKLSKFKSTLLERAESMELKDIGDGRMEYVDNMAVEDFWKAGGRGFGCTIGHQGVVLSPFEIYKMGGIYKIANIENSAMILSYVLKGGLMSSMERFEQGIIGAGCCPDENVETGSANQVFTRLLTDNQFKSNHDWRNYAIEGNIFLLMDARLAERLPYGYSSDRAGLRNYRHQSKKNIRKAQKEFFEMGLTGSLMQSDRKTLPEICKAQRMEDITLPTAEVMFEDTVSKDYVYGAVVQTKEDKKKVITVLQQQGITSIAGKSLEEAIFVGPLNNSMIKSIYK
jgi:hypothetical protein